MTGTDSRLPVVSVCMVTYMHERFIAQAIEGVLQQACDFPFELIVGDDGSTDETGRIVADYQARYPGVIRAVLQPRNIGPYENEWQCVQACRGEYIAFCEGDDYWCDPTKLARQVAAMRANPELAMVCHAVGIWDEARGTLTREARITSRSRMLSPNEVILGDGGLIGTSSILIRAEIPKNRPGWWIESPVGDYPMVLHAAQQGRVGYLDRCSSVYRINVAGSWTSRHKPDIARRAAFADRIRDMLLAYSDEAGIRRNSSVREVISKYYFDAINRTEGTSDEKRALLERVEDRMTFFDRILAGVAISLSRNLGWIRTLAHFPLRFARARANDFTQPRIAAES